ncbi:MAG: FAD-binding protein [Sandaracinaceae bacterium]|nr:FAD-binding protein [Sandaracinaceae bacterium]
MGWGCSGTPSARPIKRSRRAKAGMVHGGAGLCGKLLKALLAAGVTPLLETPGERLVVEDGAVVGLDVTHAGAPLRLRAKKGVILASGGFEVERDLPQGVLAARDDAPGEPAAQHRRRPAHAMSVGAELGNMGEAWWTPRGPARETYDWSAALPQRVLGALPATRCW